jgi:Tol biopolymer transport system component/C-terminal processing protease CtpA/Prc
MSLAMRKVIYGLTCSFAAVAVAAALAGQAPVPPGVAGDRTPLFVFSEPGISPDGREIAFSSGGDIWSVAAAGGDARLLVADAATDRRPLFSPDGRTLAFVSTRTGGGDIYTMSLATGHVTRLTWDDGLEQLDGWSADSRWIYFSSTGRDIAGMNDVFRIPAGGGTPFAVTDERYVNEFSGAASPNGRKLAFVARGIGSNQWWRRGSSHLDQSELWTVDLEGAEPVYTQVTKRESRQMWPIWSGDGTSLYYVSDRGGAENIWTRPAAPTGADRKITAFTSGRVLWPSATPDARTIVFERDFAIWTLDTQSGQARAVPIARRGAASSPTSERVRQTSQFSDLALSPDGRKLAFIAHGDVFAASAREGGDATRVTATAAVESQPAWAPDSRHLTFVGTTRSGQHLYVHDFSAAITREVTSGSVTDLSPVFSPDGRHIAFLRNHKELRVIDVASGADRLIASAVLADSIDTPAPVWSPDGRWIAVFAVGTKSFTNVEIAPAAGGVLRPVSFLANVFANSIAWSPDGTYLLFDTRQRTERGQVARVDLIPRTPKFREDLFRDLFTTPPPVTTPEPKAADAPRPEARKPEAGPVDIDIVDIRQRLSLLPIGLDIGRVAISPDGKTAVVTANAAGQTNLYAYGLEDLASERAVARQLTTTTGAKEDPQFSPDNREVYYLDAGRIQIANLERRDSRALNVTAEFTSDFPAEKAAVFEQAWTLMRDHFFDSGFNGVNWEESRERYGERAAASGTPDELRRVISLMLGDLNASHLGISAPGAPPAIGRLGLDFDRREFESAGRLRVTGIVGLGPAALANDLAVGDVITAVDGRAIGAGTNLDEYLANTIDRRVSLTVQRAAASREVIVRPVSQATEKSLRYRQWVEENRQYVLKASGGRLGYVHMINMSAAALDQLLIDLDTDNHKLDGVVIDLRNNNGGFVNAYALDVFSRTPYLRMSTRAVPEAPARGVLGQRALESPTILITNQHSLSDAEDFVEGYRTLKLGPVVGEPTAGWIIYTWDARLVDGSTLRLPRMRVKAADGGDMEMVSRKVDVAVSRPLGESAEGKDSQLDEAIRTLLRRLGRAE